MNTDEEKIYWLCFSAFPGIGPLRFRLLLDYFGNAKKAWLAGRQEYLKIGLGEKLSDRLVDFKKEFVPDDYLKTIDKLRIKVITLNDLEYPFLLKQIPDRPFVLYVRGDTGAVKDWNHTIAVVGTRLITNYGRQVTKRISEELAASGLTVVSGMAYGVDTVAHWSALGGGGKTVAVLGCGIDIIHPKTNTALYWKIINGGGMVMSEFPVGLWAEKGLFPARNRIISGLSRGVVVTEGASDSGALITARFAAEQGRDVFAVPGPITSEMSQGPTILLKNGAKLVTDAKDILEELDIHIRSKSVNSVNSLQSDQLSESEKKIIILLQKESLHFDDLARESKIPSEKLGSILSMMEMRNLVRNLGDSYYSLT